MLTIDQYHPHSDLRVAAHEHVAPPCPVIDMHTHFGALLMGDHYEDTYDTEAVVAAMKEAGLRRALALELAWEGEYERLARKLEASDGFVLPVGSVDVSKAKTPGFDALVYRQIGHMKRMGAKALKLWKNMTLHSQTYFGEEVPLDDPCYEPIFATCAQNGLPIIIHVGDPPCFFRPADAASEHYLCLALHPEWAFVRPGLPSFEEHMAMQERMIANNPATTFIVAHVGSCAEDLARVGAWLDQYPNLYIDVAARIDQLGRQPYTARDFLIRYADRILFGTDFEARFDRERTISFYETHYRFFQTRDEYFEHPFAAMLGQWRICGVDLPEDVLRKLYYENAERILRVGL